MSAIHLASSLAPTMVTAAQRQACLAGMGLEAGRYFLFASTLEPRKNLRTLLAAYAGLPADLRRRYPLVLAGQMGWGSADFEEDVRKALARGDVRLTGYLTNADLACLYGGARAFVYPSVYEGFGLPPVEAQGFGIPVITSNCSCMPEVTGEGALHVDPDDAEALGAAMTLLARDDARHAALAQLALVNAGRFSWERTASETLAVYRRVAGY